MMFAVFASAEVQFDTLTMTGLASPDGNGEFSSFQTPAINDDGTIVFRADLVNTTAVNGFGSDSGVFVADKNGLAVIVREAQQSPGIGLVKDITVAGNGQPAIAGNGFVTVTGRTPQVAPTTGSLDTIFRGTSVPGFLVEIVREGQFEPGGDGQLFTNPGTLAAVNDSGQVAFTAGLFNNNSGTFADDRGHYVSDAAGTTLTQVMRELQPAPDGDGTFGPVGGSSLFAPPTLNDNGQVAFVAPIQDSTNRGSGVFRWNPGGSITTIARQGDLLPNGEEYRVGVTIGAPLNDSGLVAFSSDNGSLFVSDGTTTTTIAEIGELALGANQTLRSVSRSLVMNESGQVIVSGDINGVTQQGGVDNALFLAGGGNALRAIAFIGMSIGNGESLNSFDEAYAINDHGQVAFVARIDEDPNRSGLENRGLFLYSDGDVIEIVRLGDPFAGGTLTDFEFSGTSSNGFLTNDHDGLNNNGQVAFWYEVELPIVADGGIATQAETVVTGLAIGVVPEPTSVTILLTMLAGAMMRRRPRPPVDFLRTYGPRFDTRSARLSPRRC